MRIASHLIAVVTAASISAGCGREETKESLAFDQVINRVDVNVTANLTVEPSASTSTFVDVDTSCTGWGSPTYKVSVEGDTLKVVYDCFQENDGRIVVRVPSSVIESVLSVDTGDMQVTHLQGRVALKADSGDISGTLACDVCSASADAGDITLELSAPPVSLDLYADSGDIRARVPAGTYSISTEVDSGDRSITGLTNDPAAPNVIKARIDSGDLSIKGY